VFCAGRTADTRPSTKAELTSTIVVALPLDEASAKIRTGNAEDDKADYELDTWAGVVPLQQAAPGTPIVDPKLKPGIQIPKYVVNYSRVKGVGDQMQTLGIAT